MPFPLKERENELGPTWVNVIGEPVGVQLLVTASEEQPASVPAPGFSVFRSILMRPAAVPENSAQSTIFGVKVGAPARLPCTVPVAPAYDPVQPRLILVQMGLGTVAKLEKKIPEL